jgi:tRNA (guanine37-N1)-methyltransferase
VKISFVSLFPEFFDGPMGLSIPGRAVRTGVVRWEAVDPRDFASGRHRTVDDAPYGGGAGMVMRPDVMGAAVEWARARNAGAPVILLSPQGAPFRQSHARALAALDGIILVCGRYEGVDERFVDTHVDAEISLGDFVLSGGEPAALAVADAVIRLVPGALGNEASVVEESFSRPLLEHPQFTRPAEYAGRSVPEALTSGDHGRVDRWRARAAWLRTLARRPDLAEAHGTPPTQKRPEQIDDWLIAPRHLDSRVDVREDWCIVRRPDAPGSSRTEKEK